VLHIVGSKNSVTALAMFCDLNIPVSPFINVPSKKGKEKQAPANITINPGLVARLETRLDLLIHRQYLLV
jgi:hypothetical protein